MIAEQSTRHHRQGLYATVILSMLIVVFSVLSYSQASISAGDGELLMPLDDVYIHFQYARQLASGDPYVYNPGDAPTSGATSFLYPYILGLGYILGFQGLSLGAWALGIGSFALILSTVTIYALARWGKAPAWLASFAAVLFVSNGAMTWHYLSGMETGLVITFTLLALYGFVTKHPHLFAVSATLLALSRPEASILAALATFMYVARYRFQDQRSEKRKRLQTLALALPVVAAMVQPSLNMILTGSASASGSRAKSILSTVPFALQNVASRILDNFARIWRELATDGDFLPVTIVIMAIVGVLALAHERRYVLTLLVLWLLTLASAISTLDTAFWHFKRYQMPIYALMFPLAVWGACGIWQVFQRRNRTQYNVIPRYALAALLLLSVIATGQSWREFHRLYAVNVDNIAAQPYPMALWLLNNTDTDARVAVHDVGMMRYVGNRYTIDIVGLTTEHAADYWRNGPGSVGEFLLALDSPPDYIAAYTTARGLNYLVDTTIYGTERAGFQAIYQPADNVALGAEFQGIFEFEATDQSVLNSVQIQPEWLFEQPTPEPVASINVANLKSEQAHNYSWQNNQSETGFITEIYEFPPVACPSNSVKCSTIDGGRRINGNEQFTVNVQPGVDSVLITRLHPAQPGSFDVYVDDVFVDTQWIPAIPGRWLEITTFIPGEHLIGTDARIRIEPTVINGSYMPYFHWVWQGDLKLSPIPATDASYQDDAVGLKATLEQHGSTASVNLTYITDGSAQGDYRVFIHIYDNVDEPPIAQHDNYPLHQTFYAPPGNWMPGVNSEEIMVDLSQLPVGRYQVALGFYNPQTMERLSPTVLSNDVIADVSNQRLFIGEIEISDNE